MTATPSYTSFETQRVGGVLGAVISGLDLSRPLSDRQFEDLQHALVTHEVVFFRDQELDSQQHLALAARFGDISLYPIEKFFGSEDPGHQIIVDDRDNPPGTDLWHTDVSWLPRPPKLAFLTVLEVPAHVHQQQPRGVERRGQRRARQHGAALEVASEQTLELRGDEVDMVPQAAVGVPRGQRGGGER
ncbi:MAG: TauD/TfdA family dioxygenase, partial [Myxococcota bacterium]